MRTHLMMLLVGAAMTALPAASAFANKDEVVILMCMDSNVSQRRVDSDPNNQHVPRVFKREATFDLPDACGAVDAPQELRLCAACLKALIDVPFLCEANLGFPRSPVLTRASDSLGFVTGETFAFPRDVNVISYTMQCENQ